MKSLFEEMGGTYRQVGDYFIPNLVLPDDDNHQIGKYGRLHRTYLKEHRKILYFGTAILSRLSTTHLPRSTRSCRN